jgi:hypothetical protein
MKQVYYLHEETQPKIQEEFELIIWVYKWTSHGQSKRVYSQAMKELI